LPLLRATSWTPDLAMAYKATSWEAHGRHYHFRTEWRKALTQIKGVPTALANIAVTSALSLIACRREFQP
jgi:hypothetical protein